MAYICEQELLSIYRDFEPRLNSSGIKAEVALIRDYLLKLGLYEGESLLGKLVIDYSPKKRTHSFRKDTDLSDEQFSRILGILGVIPKAIDRGNSLKPDKNPPLAQPQKDFSNVRHHAYVDGSFIEGHVGYGAVILDSGKVISEISGSVDTPDAFSARQVGGEIQAVLDVLEWCRTNSIEHIAIFYDFQNIEKWATGAYKTNTPMTQAYKKYIDSCGINITWVKVESHTGVELNDRADQLAKNGAKNSEQAQNTKAASIKGLSAWIIYNASLLTSKFTEQVDWFVKTAKVNDIELVAYRNDEFGAVVSDGKLNLVCPCERKPDFVIFWDKDIRLARQLERMGHMLFNSSKTIFACDDKILTHQILADNDIPMPKTLFSPHVFPNCKVDESAFISTIEKVLDYPIVVKEAFGSFGAQVYMAEDREALLALRKRLIYIPHLYQEYIRTSHGRDVRLQVVGDEVVAAMMRTSDTDFRANLSAGGRMMPFTPPREFIDLALKAAKLVRAHFAGVDILFGENEKPILCEINSNAHMKNIYECTGVDVADRIISYIKSKLV